MAQPKKNIKFALKERAYDIIKDRFDDFCIIAEDSYFYVICHKREVDIICINHANPFQLAERNMKKTICNVRVISFIDVDSTKELKTWIKLGAFRDHIDEKGQYIKDQRDDVKDY